MLAVQGRDIPARAAVGRHVGEWLTRTWSDTMGGSSSIEGRRPHCMAPAVRPLGSLSEAESVVTFSPAIVDSPMGFASATAPVSRASISAEVSANLFYWFHKPVVPGSRPFERTETCLRGVKVFPTGSARGSRVGRLLATPPAVSMWRERRESRETSNTRGQPCVGANATVCRACGVVVTAAQPAEWSQNVLCAYCEGTFPREAT